MSDLPALFVRRAGLLRELADLEGGLGDALGDVLQPSRVPSGTRP